VHDEDTGEFLHGGRIYGIHLCMIWRFRALNTGAEAMIYTPNYQKSSGTMLSTIEVSLSSCIKGIRATEAIVSHE
jgi:hypothetical protein